MSNLRVSSTRASWPRSSAALTSARVLYNSGCRDRITIRMAGSGGKTNHKGTKDTKKTNPGFVKNSRLLFFVSFVPLWLLLTFQNVLPRGVDDELGGQGGAAEEHRDEHPRAVGDGRPDRLGHRPEPDRDLDHRPPLRLAARRPDRGE